jgi:hypothetical protein
VIAACVGIGGIGIAGIFGGNDEAIAAVLEHLTEESFARTIVVKVGGVDEVPTPIGVASKIF